MGRNALVCSIVVGCVFAMPAHAAYRLDTFAGRGVGDGDLAVAASVLQPTDAATDAQGNVYFADRGHNSIRRVDAATGVITTVAGNGTLGSTGDGGPATVAQVYDPDGVALDASGTHLWIAEHNGHRVRVVDLTTGIIATFAGTGVPTGSIDGEGGDPTDDRGDGLLATQASLNEPVGIAVSPTGDVFIAERSEIWPTPAQHRPGIRRVDPSGHISTYAGGNPERLGGDGGPAVNANEADPTGIKLDGAGNLWVAELGNHRIRRIAAAPPHIITTVAGNGSFDEGRQPFRGDGGDAGAAGFYNPSRIAILPRGCGAAGAPKCTLYIGDAGHNCVRVVDPSTNVITTIVGAGNQPGNSGDGGPGTLARLTAPGVNEGPNGTILISDNGDFVNRIRIYDPATQIIKAFAGDGNGGAGGDDGPATRATLNEPRGLARNAAGETFIADHGNHRVRRVAADGTMTTVAGVGERGSNGNEGPGPAAQLDQPTGVGLLPSGDLLIVDAATMTIRRLDASLTIHAFAGTGGTGDTGDGGPASTATFDTPLRVAVAADGTVYVVELNNHVVRRIDPSGTITRFAGTGQPGNGGDGGPATSAQLRNPAGLALAPDGTLYIADFGNERIRAVDPDGTMRNVAGTGGRSGNGLPLGDGGAAGAATFADPTGIALDADGALLVADQGNNVIRRIAPDGQGGLSTRSTVTTILCDGRPTFAGEGGNALEASCNRPTDVLALGDGRLLVSDSGNHRVRLATPVTNLCDVSCDDQNPCTVDSCDPATGCHHSPTSDTDHDGVCDAIDNCPDVPNADQTDTNHDGRGDACQNEPTQTACQAGSPTCIAGGGPKKSDCLVETVVAGGTSRPTVRCTDGDASCDQDATAGTCTFAVRWCLNDTDPRLQCTAKGVDSLAVHAAGLPRAMRPPLVTAALAAVAGVAPSQTSTAGSRLAFVPTFATADTCTPPVQVTVPLRGKSTHERQGVAMLKTVAKGKSARDTDTVRLICRPPK